MLRMLALELICGRVDNDLDWLMASEFARPTDDVLLGVFVEIPFAKRKWIERVEELCDIVDPYLNSVLLGNRQRDLLLLFSTRWRRVAHLAQEITHGIELRSEIGQSPDFKRAIP
jgi:hypothetical protein